MTCRGLLHDPVAAASRSVALRWEPADATLRIGEAGGELTVAATRLSVTGGGFRGEAVHLGWTDGGQAWAVTVDGPAAVEALLGSLPPGLAPQVAQVRGQAARARRRRRVALVVVGFLLALPLLALAALYAFRGAILDAIVGRLPLGIDAELGRLVEGELARSGRVVAEGPAAEAVRLIGDRLAPPDPAAPFRFRFLLVRDAAVNAFAAPGGLVAVHTGLVARAGSPDELAGVLAHEVGHVLARHTLRQLLVELGLAASVRVLLGSPGGAGEALAAGAARLGALRFGRDQERDADQRAVDVLRRARLPAGGLVGFFDRLAEQDGAVPALLATHPPSAERSAALARALLALGPWPVERLALDWDAARRDAGPPGG
jgi:predicted Zn-dependent protease